MKKRVGILISGRGSNMMSLVAAAKDPAYPAEIVVVISNRPDAPGLAWAKSQGIPTIAIDHKAYSSRAAFEAQMQTVLTQHRCDLVACCGFLRLMTADFVNLWHDQMLNIHPALLPSYKGLHTHERALADGVRIAGCTVHVVRAEMDAGPIIGQAAVPVLDNDTPSTLAARVLAAEHQLYPHALALYASGKAQITGETVRIEPGPAAALSVALTLFSPRSKSNDVAVLQQSTAPHAPSVGLAAWTLGRWRSSNLDNVLRYHEAFLHRGAPPAKCLSVLRRPIATNPQGREENSTS